MGNETITGLYLGKFAPLHIGHEQIIKKALSECDRLVIMIYDAPELTSIPLSVRAEWFNDLCSGMFTKYIHVIKCFDGPKEDGYTPEIVKAHNDYILKKLNGNKIHKFYSAEEYGKHVSEALGAEDCRCEKTIDICATKIRSDYYKYRRFMSPRVYKDHIKKVVFLGGPSTGKSTICERMAKEYNTEFMPEYGREYWAEHQVDRKLTPEQLHEIAVGHWKREEEKVLESNRYLFIDTNAITTMLFHRYYYGFDTCAELNTYADECRDRYDIVFLCADDFPMDKTEDRSGDAQRELLQAWTRDELLTRKIRCYYLTGSIEDRVRSVKCVLFTI